MPPALQVTREQASCLVSQPISSARPPLPVTGARRRPKSKSVRSRARTSFARPAVSSSSLEPRIVPDWLPIRVIAVTHLDNLTAFVVDYYVTAVRVGVCRCWLLLTGRVVPDVVPLADRHGPAPVPAPRWAQ